MQNEQAFTSNIPYRTLIDLNRNYIDKKHRVLSATMTKEETKSIWFELDDALRSFLRETLADSKVTGIRMYILQYPQTQTEMDSKTVPEKMIDVNQLTVGIVTTEKLGNYQVDYPTSSTDTKLLFAPPVNHGSLCPQQCD
jgi:hypothetical protein